jgi:hypothetical protein
MPADAVGRHEPAQHVDPAVIADMAEWLKA